jgi:hypothetical protein
LGGKEKTKRWKMCDYEERIEKTKHKKKMTVLKVNMKEERTAQRGK